MNKRSRLSRIRDGVLALGMAWVLAWSANSQKAPQTRPETHLEPPRILYIYREFWKQGTQAALNRIETDGARMCIEHKCPHPYLGIESLTGSKEVWYLNGFNSTEEEKHVEKEYNDRGLFAAMNPFARQRAPYQSQPGQESSASYRPELSHGVLWRMGQGRYLVIEVTKDNPRGEGAVFETDGGLRFVVTPARNRTEANTRRSAGGPGAQIFVVRPQFSMPAPEWVAADPLFWGSAPTNR